MKRLWLIIFCIGAVGSVEPAGSEGPYRVVYAQDIASRETKTKLGIPAEAVTVWINKGDTFQGKLLPLEGKRVNLVLRWSLTDEDVDILRTFGHIQAVTIQGGFSGSETIHASDETIKKLTRLTDLQDLHFIAPGVGMITDAGMQMLASFKKLESLTISTCNLSETAYSSIDQLGQLRELNLRLHMSVVAEKDLAFLDRLPELRKLSLKTDTPNYARSGTGRAPLQLPESVLLRLQNLNNLEELEIDSYWFAGDGLSHLSKLKSLRKLTFGRGCDLSASGLSQLKGFPQLTDLDFGCSSVDDTAIEPLQALRYLKSLNLCSTKITQQGVEQLRQALPDCQIKR